MYMVNVKVRTLVFVGVVLGLALVLLQLQRLGLNTKMIGMNSHRKIANIITATRILDETVTDRMSLHVSDPRMDIDSDLARDLGNYLNMLESTTTLNSRQLMLLACSWNFCEHNFQAGIWAKAKLELISSMTCARKWRQTCLNPINHSNITTNSTMPQSNLVYGQHVSGLSKPTGRLERPLRLVAYHEVFTNTCEFDLEYHKDGPERFIRGYNQKIVSDISQTGFVRGSVPAHFTRGSKLRTIMNSSNDFDAVIYHAYGDAKCIHTAISRADAGQLNVPVVFMLTNDNSFIPSTCHSNLVFLVVNTQTPNISWGSTCTVYQVPNQEGENVPSDLSLSAIGERVLHTTPSKDSAGNQSSFPSNNRSLLASFQGSMGTYESRTEMLSIVAPDIVVKAVDWWGLEKQSAAPPKNWTTHREPMVVEGRRLMSESVFAFCPRGNGLSSIRVVEAIMAGTIPVLLDDFTTPFDETLCDFAVRWTMSKRLDLLVRLLRRIASDPEQLQQRRYKMWDFVQRHHPFWFDHRFMARVIREALVQNGVKS